jgi:perosamine synthetase
MNTRREFLDFHVPSIGEDEIKEVVETLRSGWLTTGAKTKRFEEEFAEYVGAKHAIAVNSGTAALHLALDAIGLERGDEVIVPTTTFAATAEVVIYFNARPVLVDIDSRTLNIDPVKLETKVEELKAKGSKLKAIIPVHFAKLWCQILNSELRDWN